ncbi:hypothetical protein L6452_21775 [Arctium lappa]|uniref:Uncharacterized protein n=1 Tax=Arctium lappa TaxID=4217 RepID=A0ACB9AXZ7_ARCLA|nr:hypothetical protein L6452_21775 [Arctium lappa]
MHSPLFVHLYPEIWLRIIDFLDHTSKMEDFNRGFIQQGEETSINEGGEELRSLVGALLVTLEKSLEPVRYTEEENRSRRVRILLWGGFNGTNFFNANRSPLLDSRRKKQRLFIFHKTRYLRLFEKKRT